MSLQQIELDCTAQPTCRCLIIELQKAYLLLVSGNARLKVRFEERWVEYHPASAPRLLQLLNTVWDQCDDKAGLTDFRPQRGDPFMLRIT